VRGPRALPGWLPSGRELRLFGGVALVVGIAVGVLQRLL